MGALDLVRLRPLMAKTQGRREFVVALIDGPVALDHPDLAKDRIRAVPGKQAAACDIDRCRKKVLDTASPFQRWLPLLPVVVHCTVKVRFVLWTSDPAVPVTVMV